MEFSIEAPEKKESKKNYVRWIVCFVSIRLARVCGYHRTHLNSFILKDWLGNGLVLLFSFLFWVVFFFSISSTIWFELNTSSTLLSLLPSSWPPCIEHQIGYTWLLMQFILLKLYWMESISQTYSHMQWKHYSQQQNMVFTPNFTLFGPNNAHGSKNIHRIVNRRISNNFHWVEMTGKRRE